MKVAVKEVGKELEILETKEKYRLDCVKQFIGRENYAEFVMLNDDGTFCMGVDEDGLPHDLPVNFLFSTTNMDFPIQKAVGTVVFVRHKYENPWLKEIYDFEVDNLTDKDIEYIHKMLDVDYQKKLLNAFSDYGRGYAVIRNIEL